MCRADVRPEAAELLGDLLGQLVEGVARMYGCDPADVTVGPVDFGLAEREERGIG